MSILVKEGARPISVSTPEDYRRAIADGYRPRDDGPVALTTRSGRTVEAAGEDLDALLQEGAGFEAGSAAAQRAIAAERENVHGGTLGAIQSFGEAALGAATFGLTDIIGAEAGADIQARREANPDAAFAGEMVGLIGPGLASGGTGIGSRILAATPAGLATRAATGIAARGAGRGLAARAAFGAAGFATEGALYNAGDYLARSYLEDTELSAESFLAATGRGALFGGGIGGAFPVVGAGLRAAGGGVSRLLRTGGDDVVEAGLEGATKATAEISEETSLKALTPKGRSPKQLAEETLGDLEMRTAEAQTTVDDILEQADRLAPPVRGPEPIRVGDDLFDANTGELIGDVAALRAETAALKDKWFNEIMPSLRETAEANRKAPRWRGAKPDEEWKRPLYGRADQGRASLAAQSDPLAARILDDVPTSGTPLEPVPRRPSPLPGEFEGEVARLNESIVRQGQKAVESGRFQPVGGRIVDTDTGQIFDNLAEAARVAGDLDKKMLELTQKIEKHIPPEDAARLVEATAPMREAVESQGSKTAEATARAADDAAGNPWVRKAMDAAAIAEGLQTAGLPLPDADQIPVIGPILGAYLKYRAARALLRGGTEGVVKTTKATKAAEKVAQTRNKLADGIDRLIGASKKPGPSGARVGLPAARLILGRPLFDGTARRGASTQELVAERTDELTRAVANPMKLREYVRQQVGDALPQLASAIEAGLLNKFQYLLSKAPQDPRPPNPLNEPWEPSRAEANEFARRVRAAEDPGTLLKDLQNDELSMEAAETVRDLYPRLYMEMRTQLIQRITEKGAKVPRSRRVAISLAFDVAGDVTMEPSYLVASQMVEPEAEPSPTLPETQTANIAEAEQYPGYRS